MLPEQSERGYHRTWEKTTQPLCTPSLWVKSFIVRWYGIVIIKIKKTGAPAFFPHTRLKDQKTFAFTNYAMLWEKKIGEENK